MAMHVHSSFSEGSASMHGHLHQAQRLGVDVVMWTDHDFRLRAHGYRTGVRFDGPAEVDDRVTWAWRRADDGPAARRAADFVDEPRSPHQEGRALRLTSRATSQAAAWSSTRLVGSVTNSLATTSLAATVLQLDVLAESLGPDAQLVVEITSSYRPATAGRPAGQYRLHYRLGGGTGRWTERRGLVGVVGLPVARGWQTLALDLQADVAALWPDLVSADAGLCALSVVARSRRGASAAVVLDRLELVRTRRAGGEALALQREAMAAYASAYPAVRQHQGSEVSLVRHLNAYGEDLRLPEPPTSRATKDTSVGAALAAVAQLRRSAALVCFNHPLEDAPTARALGDLLVSTGALGADLVEIGSKEDLDASVAGYDIAARNAVLVTATGVSDDHAGRDWLALQQRWLTSAWAASTDLEDLAGALRGGRAWFWDPRSWRGQVDLVADGRARMGGVLLTRSDAVALQVSATAPPPGGRLELVVGVVDLAGREDLTPRTTRRALAGTGSPQTVRVDASGARGAYARVEVRDASGGLVGFSNPLWMLHAEPAGGVLPERRSA